jgi:sulfoxide reductase heme-binding subunit YedZ
VSVGYQAVGWNRQKKIYDRVLGLGVVLYLALFVGVGVLTNPNATAETLVIRGFGTGALLLLHVVLSIGPLCRLDSRFLPLLYNRRHLGMAMFLMALIHGGFSILQFHAFGNTHPLVSLFTASSRYTSLAWFPFQPLGFGALVILFLMAVTSHDFWLANLGPRVWKTLHMLVYVAYALLIGHVVLGSLQAESNPLLAGLLAVGLAWILTIHLVAGWRERPLDRERSTEAHEGFVEVCAVDDIQENRARIITLSGERVAVFRYEGKISALNNACRHQNGPLGEGRIIDGCITCPWHGFQYRPADGCSPPPFTERVQTYDVRVDDGRVYVNPAPHPPGTPVDPAVIPTASSGEADA